MSRWLLTAAAALALAAPASASILPGFKSPTGNIRCVVIPGRPSNLHCDIGRAGYAARLQDKCINPKGEMGAGVDWHGFELPGRGTPHLSCSGGALIPGSAHPRYVELPYGHTWRFGVFTCASRVTGVTCRNRQGHGVFISRAAYRLF